MDRANTYSQRWFDLFAEGIEPAQTHREVNWIASVAPPATHPRVLDVCCGLGRHAGAMAERGYEVVGLDRDEAAVQKARQRWPTAAFIVGDMRDVSAGVSGKFDVVTLLWQSFGYFDDQTNASILRDLRSVTRDGGLLLLDVYHAGFFRAHIGVREFQAAGGMRVRESKSVHGQRLSVVLTYENGEADVFDWQIFTPDELAEFAAGCGWKEITRCTGFEAARLPDESTPRMQMVFRRTED